MREGCGEVDLGVGGADADVVGDARGVVYGASVEEGVGPGGVGCKESGLC
jgi:hypothetical protein